MGWTEIETFFYYFDFIFLKKPKNNTHTHNWCFNQRNKKIFAKTVKQTARTEKYTRWTEHGNVLLYLYARVIYPSYHIFNHHVKIDLPARLPAWVGGCYSICSDTLTMNTNARVFLYCPQKNLRVYVCTRAHAHPCVRHLTCTRE